MKKLVFGLIATVMFGFVGSAQNEIKLSDYGFYHNEFLSMYFSNYKLTEEMNINTFIDHSIALAKQKYSGKFENVDLKKLKGIFAGQTIKDFDYLKIWNNRKAELLSQNLLSPPIIQFIDDVNTNNYTIDEAIKLVTVLQNSKTISTSDANALIIGKSVMIASHNYWTSNGTNTTNEFTPKEVADFGCAIMFWECGPLALVAGFIGSGLTR